MKTITIKNAKNEVSRPKFAVEQAPGPSENAGIVQSVEKIGDLSLPSRKSLELALQLTDDLEGAKKVVSEIEAKIASLMRGEVSGIQVLDETIEKQGQEENRGRRGKVKVQVMEALKKAGKRGITIGDLAEIIGTSKANISAWFSLTGSKDKRIVRIAPGMYRLENGNGHPENH